MKHRYAKYRKQAVSLLFSCAVLTTNAGAVDIAASDIGTGISRLISDLSGYLTVLAPIAGGCVAVYFAIRRSMADEQDGKMWMHRIIVAISCGVGGGLIGGVISLLASYF